MEAKPHNHKGAPALAGYLGTDTPLDHREDTVCRVGHFPKARRAFGGFPKPCDRRECGTSGETEVRRMWVLSQGET